MSSPIARSFDANGASQYAPKWARNLGNKSGLHSVEARLLPLTNDDNATVVPAVSANREVGQFLFLKSLDPVPVPEPPIATPSPSTSARFLARDDRIMGKFIPLLLTIFLAALISFVIVVELPNIGRFFRKQPVTENSFKARFNGEAFTSSWPLSRTLAPRSASAAGSNSKAKTDDRPAPAINSSGVAVQLSSTSQAQFSVTMPAKPAAATSRQRIPLPGPVRAPTTDKAPNSGVGSPIDVKAVAIRPAIQARPLGRDEIETLLVQGNKFVSVGDFASARLLFSRISEANEARGALAFAATYDPIVLADIGAEGTASDVAKAREWYARAKDLGSAEAAARLNALVNHATARRTNLESSIPSQTTTAADSIRKEVSNDVRSQSASPNHSNLPPGSYWQSGQSVMRLEAMGNHRKFYFYTPSHDQLDAGAKAGVLRFDGKISEDGYTGTAFLYHENCGRLAFPVSGPIEESDGRVALSGKAPRMNNNCRVVGKKDQTLVFTFIETNSH